MDFLRVNMSTKKITVEKVKERYRLSGNRGLVARLSFDEIDPQCHPLGPNNKLIIGTSPLDALGVTCMGRLSVGGKSPLTGGIKEANAGGVAATKLVRHGIKAIIVEQTPVLGELFLLHITKQGVQLKPAKRLAGVGTYTVVEKIYEEYGRDVGILTIGPAGEQRLASAGVFVNDLDGDPSRAAARGGMGAVMGSKGLKAIVIDDDGDCKPEVSDDKAFREARTAFTRGILDEPTVKFYSEYGTMGGLMSLHALGALPVHSFRRGSWEKAEEISGDKFHDIILERGGEGKNTHKCMPVCVIQCSNVFADKTGKRIVAPLEYECAGMLGSNLGIDDLDKIGHLTRLCNDVGLDAVETGAAIGTIADAGLFDFGNAHRAEELIKEIGTGSVLGKVLGAGAAVVGNVFGLRRVPVVKGQAIAAHDPRGIKGMSVTYSMSPMGADHTAAATYRAPVDHHKAEGQLDASRNLQVVMAFYDNFCCMFIMRGIIKKPELFVNLINAVYGTNYGTDYLATLGKEIIKLERVFNIAAGVTQEYLPEFMRSEKLEPQGLISDIPQSDYDRFWDESFWGEFPKIRRD
ncbi:MAG: aldehyde ferredoxin oxidoreductase C-terminal domain-containing protein [Thermodesulfobacteriota bacterium]